MKHSRLLLLVLFGMAAFPQPAWANAGTPLMWAGMLHLVFGNALIGLGEGLLLAWVFFAPKVKTVLTLILANYVSAWLGGHFILAPLVQALPLDLTNAWRWLWGNEHCRAVGPLAAGVGRRLFHPSIQPTIRSTGGRWLAKTKRRSKTWARRTTMPSLLFRRALQTPAIGIWWPILKPTTITTHAMSTP